MQLTPHLLGHCLNNPFSDADTYLAFNLKCFIQGSRIRIIRILFFEKYARIFYVFYFFIRKQK
jgi:hypothetical protein